MKILVVGIGYVGLVTATAFAEMGHNVICLDIDTNKISNLKKGLMPYYEPGLKEMVLRNLEANRLTFTTEFHDADICFLAVSTPENTDGSANLSHIHAASKMIGRCMKAPAIIVNKSTVPPGTAHTVKKIIHEELKKRALDLNFEMVSNPEFLKEGSAIQDCMKPERIIIGCDSEEAIITMKKLYSSFTLCRDRILIMDILSAEMTKYAANAMLASRVSLMNELAGICEEVGADICKVRTGIGSDSRIGYDFLYAGIGYGGSCFPKDIRAIRTLAREKGCNTPMLLAIEAVNESQKVRFMQKIQDRFKADGGIAGKSFAIWGLSFKPNTDDLREAPALFVIESLQKLGAHLKLFDPIAMDNAEKIIPKHPNTKFCKSEYEAATDVDAVILITEWKQFRFVDLSEIKKLMRGKLFFDGRNQYKRQEMLRHGFDYHAIGTPRLGVNLLQDLLSLSSEKAESL